MPALIFRSLAFLLLVNSAFGAENLPAVDIVFIGDSITAGAGLRNAAATQAPPVICGKQVQARLNGVPVYISNQGHSGHTTVDFLPSSHRDFSQMESATRTLLAQHPGKLLFSVMLGTNDSAVTGPHGSPVSPEDYGKNLTTIINQLLMDFPQSQVFIQQPIWYSTNTHNHSTYDQAGLDRLNSYFPVIGSVVDAQTSAHPGLVHRGDTAGYAYFQANYLTMLQPEAGVEGTFYLHPNVNGAAKLGGFWADAILTVISPKP